MDILIDPYSQGSPVLLLSGPYPVVAADQMNLAADFDGGYCVSLLPPENVDLSADVEAASLTVTVSYASYVGLPEAANLAADFEAGSLTVTTTYVTHAGPPEAADLAADFESASLTVTTTYVTYADWTPEGADLSADFEGASLG